MLSWILALLGLGGSADAPAEEQGPPKPVPLDLNDHFGLKRHLDEVASDIIISRGYDEDFTWSNVKITLGLLACAAALVAQFYPIKFPDNIPLLIVCIVLYLLFNLGLQLLSMFKEHNVFLFTYPQQGSFTQTGLAVSSRLPRFSDTYTLRIESADPASVAARPPVELSKSVTKWYTSEGVLAEDIFLEDVQRLVEQYEDDTRKTK